MLLNDAKGSYGMYSRAGRNTVEKYHLLMRKDEILSGNKKRIYVKGNLNAEEFIKVINCLFQTSEEDEDIDIFVVEKKLKLNKDIRKLDDHHPRASRSKYFGKRSLIKTK